MTVLTSARLAAVVAVAPSPFQVLPTLIDSHRCWLTVGLWAQLKTRLWCVSFQTYWWLRSGFAWQHRSSKLDNHVQVNRSRAPTVDYVRWGERKQFNEKNVLQREHDWMPTWSVENWINDILGFNQVSSERNLVEWHTAKEFKTLILNDSMNSNNLRMCPVDVTAQDSLVTLFNRT